MHTAITSRYNADFTNAALRKLVASTNTPQILPPSSLLPCAQPGSLGDDQVESGTNSLEALADYMTGKLGEIEPKRTCVTLKSPQRWKHPNICVFHAEGCDQQLSVAVSMLMLETWSRGTMTFFRPLSG